MEEPNELRAHFVAGVGAGIASALITCPLDVVKTRLQNQSTVKKYTGTFQALKLIFREEGVRGLYRGLEPMMLGYLPSSAIYFSAYYQYKRFFSKYYGGSKVHVASACCAGVTSSVATSPFWVVKTRLMLSSEYPNTFQAMRQIVRTEGVRGLYKGLTPSLLGVSHVAVQFPVYEKLKEHLSDGSLNSGPQIICASVLSKICATLITYPHEVVRTRMQNQRNDVVYRGIVQSVKLIWRKEGYRGLYRGLGTNLVRVLPATAVTFLSYETILREFHLS